MLYSEIIAVCSQIHTKLINTLCGQNVEFVNVKTGGTYSDHRTVHIVTTELSRVHTFTVTSPYNFFCILWLNKGSTSRSHICRPDQMDQF